MLGGSWRAFMTSARARSGSVRSPGKSMHTYASIVAELVVTMCGEAKPPCVRPWIRARRIWRGDNNVQ